MSKKNRKNKKKKKGKESDSRRSSTGDGSSNNNNNNRNNNDITIPTVVDETVAATTTTTTTMVLTQQDLEFIDNKCMLKGYPKSTNFVIGYKYWMAQRNDAAVDAFKRGADDDSCVPCMYFYVYVQWKRDNYYLLLPYAFEGAIRGHLSCMARLIDCYDTSKPSNAALLMLWAKMMIEFDDTDCTEEERKEIKEANTNFCQACGKKESEDNNDVTLVKCGICKFYSYCGKDCQTHHWQEWKHMHECRQVILLRKYCKPSYVKEIREAIISGQDPKEIHTLQRLRMKLGLNRPKEEYEDLVLRLDDSDDSTIQDRYNYLTARKDGTLHIGSTPNVI